MDRRQFMQIMPQLAMASTVLPFKINNTSGYVVVIRADDVDEDAVRHQVKEAFDAAGVTDTKVGVIVLPYHSRIRINEVPHG